MNKPERTAKQSVLVLIRKHGANGTIQALADALRDLGAEWRGDDGAAVGVEMVTGYSPHSPDDYRWAARCGECPGCQEYMLAPVPQQGCCRREAQGSFAGAYPGAEPRRGSASPKHPTGGFAHFGCRCTGCRS